MPTSIAPMRWAGRWLGACVVTLSTDDVREVMVTLCCAAPEANDRPSWPRVGCVGGWSGSIFGASFFTLTGMHGFHVFCGVVYLAILWWQTKQKHYDQTHYFGLTAGTLYWHFVDVIWVALFFLFYIF